MQSDFLNAKEITRKFILDRLAEFALFDNEDIVNDIRVLINYCKTSSKFQSVAHTGNLEVLFNEIYSGESGDLYANLIRDLYIELRCSLGDEDYFNVIKMVAIVISDIGNCALVSKNNKHPSVPSAGLEKIYISNYWLFVCIMIRLTSFIDTEFEDETKGTD